MKRIVNMIIITFMFLTGMIYVSAASTYAASNQNAVHILDTSWSMEYAVAVYEGVPVEPEVIIEYDNHILVEGVDYILTYENNNRVGQAWIKAEGIGGYTGEVYLGLVDIVNDAEYIEVIGPYTVYMDQYLPEYTGKPITPYVDVQYNSNGNLANGFSVEYINSVNAGTAKAIVTLPGNEYDPIVIPYEIEKSSVNGINFKLKNKTTVFTGKAITPKMTASYNGKALVQGKDFTVSTDRKAVNAGEYDITVKGKGNYAGQKTCATLTVTRKSMTASDVTVKLEYSKALFSGADYRPKAFITYKGKTYNAKLNGCDLTYKNNNSTGTATVNIKGTVNGNFKGSVKRTFKIIYTDTAQSVRTYKSGHDDVTVFWNKIKKADGYYVYYKTASEKNFTKYVKATSTSKTIKNLEDGKKYYFRVYPYVKSNGNDAVCKEGGETYTHTLKKMGIPSVKKSGSGKVKVSWSRYNKVYGGYQIAQTNNKTKKTTYTTVNGSNISSKVIKAKKGVSYTYKVRMFSNDKKRNGVRTKVYAPWSKTIEYKY